MLGQFHDGFFNGLLIDEESAYLFICTLEGERFAIRAMGLVALLADDIKAGNIILEVAISAACEIDREAVREVHGFPQSPQGDKWADEALLQAKSAELSLLVINPAYGGSCLALAKEFALVPEVEVITRLFQASIDPRG